MSIKVGMLCYVVKAYVVPGAEGRIVEVQAAHEAIPNCWYVSADWLPGFVHSAYSEQLRPISDPDLTEKHDEEVTA